MLRGWTPTKATARSVGWLALGRSLVRSRLALSPPRLTPSRTGAAPVRGAGTAGLEHSRQVRLAHADQRGPRGVEEVLRRAARLGVLGYDRPRQEVHGRASRKAAGRRNAGAPDPELGKTASHWLSYMSAADVDAAVTKAKAAGANVLAGPVDVGTLGRAAVLADPQGAPFGLVRLSAGDPPDPAEPDREHVLLERVPHARPGRDARFLQRALPLRDDDDEVRGCALRGAEERPAPAPASSASRTREKTCRPTGCPTSSSPTRRRSRRASPAWGAASFSTPSPEHRNGSLAVVADPAGAVVALQKFPF